MKFCEIDLLSFDLLLYIHKKTPPLLTPPGGLPLPPPPKLVIAQKAQPQLLPAGLLRRFRLRGPLHRGQVRRRGLEHVLRIVVNRTNQRTAAAGRHQPLGRVVDGGGPGTDYRTTTGAAVGADAEPDLDRVVNVLPFVLVEGDFTAADLFGRSLG